MYHMTDHSKNNYKLLNCNSYFVFCEICCYNGIFHHMWKVLETPFKLEFILIVML
jgi:hypothetical protein